MLLGAFGVHMDEAQLRHLTDCSPLGTDAFQLIEAARQLGFPASRKYTLASLEELELVLREEGFPIIYMDMWPLQGGLSGQYHAVVVLDVDSDSVTVLDPASITASATFGHSASPDNVTGEHIMALQ